MMARRGDSLNGNDTAPRSERPNILIMCVDQWPNRVQLPDRMPLPALERLAAQGVTFERQYCTAPMCTPSRAALWTGTHAVQNGMWDNTNYFGWINELSSDVPTIGHMLREQGYYTAFKGKWHLSAVPNREDALERFGFADYQQWGETFGAPLEGEKIDGALAFETADWLEHRAGQLGQPWLLVCSIVSPHDIMFLQTDPVQSPHPQGMANGLQTTVQQLGWFEQQWESRLPDNFADDYAGQPWGVQHFKRYVDLHFGVIPDARTDLWLKHRNYLLNCMRFADAQLKLVLDALDRLGLWQNTVVIFTSDHGEMNGAHRMTQKGGIHFDEAANVPFIACVPGGPQGQHSGAVGSHLDLAPTLLEFAGLDATETRARYPRLKGRSLKAAMLDPSSEGPRGNVNAPGDGALVSWDALHSLDNEWAVSGALKELTDLSIGLTGRPDDPQAKLREVTARYGAPDLTKRAFYRAVVDGRYKLVRWFSPQEYGNPSTLDELYAHSDVGLYDLQNDPGELDNIGNQAHPQYDAALVERLLAKLHALVQDELGDDRAPFDLNLFGSRDAKPERGPGGLRPAA